jgi:hypothetical protein
LIGLITTCASFIAIDCVKHISTVSTQLEKNLLGVSKYDISTLLADGSAIISTGVTNLIEERSRSMIVSAVFGGLLTYGIIHGFGNFYEKIVEHIRGLCQKTTQHMIQVGHLTIADFLKQWNEWNATQLEKRLSVSINNDTSNFNDRPSTRTDDNSADILESRSWNEGAKIYTTRNAIETFRSQSEKYHRANIVSKFDDEVDNTQMDTTNSEYVYAYATSNNSLSVASSSSHAPLTNTYGHILDRSRATNESSNSNPQFNWYNQSNQYSTNMTNEFNQPGTINESNMRLPVKLLPVICWDTNKQSYTFSNPNEWSAFPNNAKVVGFIGTKKSGRTTAIHSLLFELGYYLTEEQLAKSLLPVGVMMYVLTKHDLIFLDCCDIADSATAIAGNLVRIFQLFFV